MSTSSFWATRFNSSTWSVIDLPGDCGCCQLSVDPAYELVLRELNRAEPVP